MKEPDEKLVKCNISRLRALWELEGRNRTKFIARVAEEMARNQSIIYEMQDILGEFAKAEKKSKKKYPFEEGKWIPF